MYSFYGGKQGRTYNIVQRYDEIFLNIGDETLYPPYNSTYGYSTGEKFRYEDDIYLVIPYEDDGSGGIIDMTQDSQTHKPKDLGTKIIQLHGMVNEFMKGGSYTDVNYGQYVIIDTILNLDHKNDDINGILYRRGLDYTESPSSISRPSRIERQDRTFQYSVDVEDQVSGDIVPEIRYFTVNVFKFHDYEVDIREGHQDNPTIDDLNDLGFNTAKWTSVWRSYVVSPGGGAIYIGQIVGPLGNSPELYLYDWETFQNNVADTSVLKYQPTAIINNMGQYPGVYYDQTEEEYIFNDNIKAGYYNLIDTDGNYYAASISFKIPYPVIRATGITVNPYGEDNIYHTDLEGIIDAPYSISSTYSQGRREYSNLIHQHSNGTNHPYYKDWQIAIPKGIKGDSISNIEISPSVTIASGATPRSITTTVVNYDATETGTPTSAIVGYLNEIDHLTLDENYNLSAFYTTGFSQALGQINTIKNLNYLPGTTSGSNIIATYMDNTTTEVGRLDTITNISRDGDNLVATYSDGTLTTMTVFGSTPRTVTFAPTTASGTPTTYYSYDKLRTDYPRGFGTGETSPYNHIYDNPSYKGQIAIITTLNSLNNQEESTLYAFDYETNTWSQIYKYSLEQDTSPFVTVASGSASTDTYHVNNHGIVFILEQTHSHADYSNS